MYEAMRAVSGKASPMLRPMVC